MLGSLVAGFDGSDEAIDAATLGEIFTDHSAGSLALVQVHADSDSILAPAARDVEVVQAGSVAEGLQRAAEEHGAGLVLVGSSGVADNGQVLAGRVARELLRESRTPVAVVPAGYRRRYAPDARLIGVGFDGSGESWMALEWAVETARELGAAVRLLTATRAADVAQALAASGRASLAGSYRHALREELERALAIIPQDVPSSTSVLHGEPITALLAEAGRLDLMVIGSASGGPLRRALIGSVSAGLLQGASCPLLVVPGAAAAARAAALERKAS